MLSEISQEVDNGYAEIHKVLNKLGNEDLKSVMVLCNLYSDARLAIDKPFILDGSITGESEPRIFQNMV